MSDFKLQWYTAQGTPEVQLVTTSAGEHIHEIQRIESRAVVDNVYGFFTLSFRGEMSRSIPHNAGAWLCQGVPRVDVDNRHGARHAGPE